MQLTVKHDGNVYVRPRSPAPTFRPELTCPFVQVTYKVPFSAHLQKPVAVATAFLGLFALALAWKRVDIRIRRK